MAKRIPAAQGPFHCAPGGAIPLPTLGVISETSEFASSLAGVEVGVEEGFGDEAGDCEGALGAATTTPLFHTSFPPDLIQVNSLPETIEMAPALVHAAPAFTAALAVVPMENSDKPIANRKISLIFIPISSKNACGQLEESNSSGYQLSRARAGESPQHPYPTQP